MAASATRSPALSRCLLRGGFVLCLCVLSIAQSAEAPSCPAGVIPGDSTPLAESTATQNCSPKTSRGFPIPDSACTPGAVNPTVTLKVLQSGRFKTGCERNKASNMRAKNATYGAYGITHPTGNTGKNQLCELDHLVSLELGGADTVDNIWPQCGPNDVALAQRYFKIKDGVENYLAAQVRHGQMNLAQAQRGIAHDWTQYLGAARAYWSDRRAAGFGRDE
ncbi:MAG TPA: hypothetical protein VIX87_00890 [Steroidobacteraceae bacterium]